MEYNDEELLTVSGYEIMAKAYANELKKRGFMVVQIDNEKNTELINQIFDKMLKIKSQLFTLGGFLNTGNFYSLNERQIKKLSLLLDFSLEVKSHSFPHDKTKCFLAFLSTEFELIKLLLEFAEKSNYESEIKKIIDSRLTSLSQTLSI